MATKVTPGCVALQWATIPMGSTDSLDIEAAAMLRIAGTVTQLQCATTFRSTTILTVRHNGRVAIGGDGQVSLGDTVMKADAVKIRPLADGRVIAGFAGGAADAFALLERFEAKLKDYPANMPRAATELAKEWRTDRALRRLEAMIAVVDAQHTLLVSGTGDVIQPTDGILGIGSGGNFAQAAAKALVAHSQPLRRRDRPRRPRNRRRHLRVLQSKHRHRRTARIIIRQRFTTRHRGHGGSNGDHDDAT